MTNTTCLERLLEQRAKYQLALHKTDKDSERQWYQALLETVDIQLNCYFKLHDRIENFELQMEDIKYTRLYLSETEIETLEMFLLTVDFITRKLKAHSEATDDIDGISLIARFKTLRQLFPKQLKVFLSSNIFSGDNPDD